MGSKTRGQRGKWRPTCLVGVWAGVVHRLQAAQRVHRGWEPGVGRDVDHHLFQLVAGEAGVAGAAQVHVELGLAAAHRGEHRDRDEGTIALVQTGARVHVAVPELHDVPAQVTETVDDRLGVGAVDCGDALAPLDVARGRTFGLLHGPTVRNRSQARQRAR